MPAPSGYMELQTPSSYAEERCKGCSARLAPDRRIRSYCSLKCARYNKPLPRVATAYLAEEYPLLFQRDEHSQKRALSNSVFSGGSPQGAKRHSQQTSSHWAVVRRAVLAGNALRAEHGRGCYFPADYDPVASVEEDIQAHAAIDRSMLDVSAARRRSRRPPRSQLAESHFMAAPDAPPVPPLPTQSSNSRPSTQFEVVSNTFPVHLRAPVTELAKRMTKLNIPENSQRRTNSTITVQPNIKTEDPLSRGRVEAHASRTLHPSRPDVRRASSLSAMPSSARASQYSDVRPSTLGEDSPILVPDRFTIDSMFIEKLLAGPSRETLARYDDVINNSAAPPVPTILENYSSTSAPLKSRASRTKSRTASRLGPEFRASAWGGNAPRDVWQTVRTLRDDDDGEIDYRDKLLSRDTAYMDN